MLTTIILAAAVALTPANKASFKVSVSIAESCRFERVEGQPSVYCNGREPHRVSKEPIRIEVEEMGVIEGQRMLVVF